MVQFIWLMLQLLLVALKLTDVLKWKWWVILIPTYIFIVIIIVLAVLVSNLNFS